MLLTHNLIDEKIIRWKKILEIARPQLVPNKKKKKSHYFKLFGEAQSRGGRRSKSGARLRVRWTWGRTLYMSLRQWYPWALIPSYGFDTHPVDYHSSRWRAPIEPWDRRLVYGARLASNMKPWWPGCESDWWRSKTSNHVLDDLVLASLAVHWPKAYPQRVPAKPQGQYATEWRVYPVKQFNP